MILAAPGKFLDVQTVCVLRQLVLEESATVITFEVPACNSHTMRNKQGWILTEMVPPAPTPVASFNTAINVESEGKSKTNETEFPLGIFL